jgi:PCRF domain
VHRVQRVPVTDGAGKVQTSTATVAVMPEVRTLRTAPSALIVVVVCPIVALLVLFILHLTGTCECECVCAFVCFSLNRLRTYVFTDEVYTICVLTVDVSRNSIGADNCS